MEYCSAVQRDELLMSNNNMGMNFKNFTMNEVSQMQKPNTLGNSRKAKRQQLPGAQSLGRELTVRAGKERFKRMGVLRLRWQLHDCIFISLPTCILEMSQFYFTAVKLWERNHWQGMFLCFYLCILLNFSVGLNGFFETSGICIKYVHIGGESLLK